MALASWSRVVFPLLIISELGYGPALAQEELHKLVASDAEIGDNYGISVAIDGNLAVVGSYLDDDGVVNSGSAYVIDVATGAELGKLRLPDPASFDQFGWTVGVSGTRAIIGSYKDDDLGVSSGSAHIFDLTNGQRIFELTASDGLQWDFFGLSVAIDGNLAIVGAPREPAHGDQPGAAYVYDVTTGQELFKLLASDGAGDDQFGTSVDISGDRAIVGAIEDDDSGSNSGSAYVFDLSTGQELFKLLASDGDADDLFGYAVAIEGDVALVGAYQDEDAGSASGSVYVFDAATGQETDKWTASDAHAQAYFGISVAVSGNRAVIGAMRSDFIDNNAGAAYIFDVASGEELFQVAASDGWQESGTAPGFYFGRSVAIDGDRAIVGAIGAHAQGTLTGAAYVFSTDGLGANYCTGAANSTNYPSTISATGSVGLGDQSLELHASHAPLGQTGIFYVGPSTSSVPFGNGIRCVSGTTVRLYSPVGEVGGAFRKTVDFGLHGAVLASVNPANFQCWYRDPADGGAGFNLSDGLTITFAP